MPTSPSRPSRRTRGKRPSPLIPSPLIPPPLPLPQEGRGGSAVISTPVRELAALVRARKVSPVELTELYLDRVERLGPTYNAVVTVMRDHALSQARRAQADMSAAPP